MVLVKLPVPGRPTHLDYSRARPTAFAVGAGGVVWTFVSQLSFLFSLSIWVKVGQGPTAVVVGAGGGCLDIFTLIYPFSSLSPSMGDGPI